MTERPKEEEGFSFWDRSIDSNGFDDIGSIDGIPAFTATRRLRRALPVEPPEPKPEPAVFSVFDREDSNAGGSGLRDSDTGDSDDDDFDAEDTGPFPLQNADTLPPPPARAAPTSERVVAATSFGQLKVSSGLSTQPARPGPVSRRGPIRVRNSRRGTKERALAGWLSTFDQPPPLAMAAMAGSFAIVLAAAGYWVLASPGDEVTVAGPAEVAIDGSSEAEPPLAPELGEDAARDLTRPSPEAAPVVEDTEPDITTEPQPDESPRGESEEARRAREKAAESTTTTSKPQPSSTVARAAEPEPTTTTVEPTTTMEPTTTLAPNVDGQNEEGQNEEERNENGQNEDRQVAID